MYKDLYLTKSQIKKYNEQGILELNKNSFIKKPNYKVHNNIINNKKIPLGQFINYNIYTKK